MEWISSVKFIEVAPIVISLIAIFLSWRAFNRDRSEVRIHLGFMHEEDPFTGAPTGLSKPYIAIRAVNHGRRPVVLESPSITLQGGHAELVRFPGESVKVDEAEVYSVLFSVSDIKASDTSSFPKLISVGLRDTYDNEYRFPGWSLKNRLQLRYVNKSLQKWWEVETRKGKI